MHRARAYRGSKLGPEKQARQNPKVGLGIGLAIKLYKGKSKCNIRGKCNIYSDTSNLFFLIRNALELKVTRA